MSTKRDLASSGVPKDDLCTPAQCVKAVQLNYHALLWVPKSMRTVELYETAVWKNGNALRYVPPEMRTRELCSAAVRQNRAALVYVPEALRAEMWTTGRKRLP